MEHTCIKDDGGTPNRTCHACAQEKQKIQPHEGQTLTARQATLIHRLHQDFDHLLITEVKEFNGIPVQRGRTGTAQQQLRATIAELIAEFVTHEG